MTQGIQRECVQCGAIFTGFTRKCLRCQRKARQCDRCGVTFTGRERICNRCRQPMQPCEFPGCEGPKVPGHGSKYCQLHRDGAYRRKLQRMQAKTLEKPCQWEDCTEQKQGGTGSRYCAEHSRGNMERQRVRMRARSRERQYGITHDEYLALLAAQGERCAICGSERSATRTLSVDHDHDTGAVRGLLCNRCNPMLGYARDDVAVLQAAIEYLTRSRRSSSA